MKESRRGERERINLCIKTISILSSVFGWLN